MIRTVLVGSGLIVVCLFVQSTWLHAIEIWGVIPDIGLLTLIFISYKNAGSEGQLSGFIAGAIQDFISASPLGFNAFVKALVGFLYGAIAGNFYVDKLLLPIFFGFSGTLIKAIGVSALSWIFPSHVHAYRFAERALWVEAGYNALLAPIVFLILGLFGRLLVTSRNRE
jgi:rod shape-determining protein MreD